MADKVFALHYDDEKIIRSVAQPVSDPQDPALAKLVKEMVGYLKNSQVKAWSTKHKVRAGVGLAAPQIGDPRRFFAVYVDLGGENGLKQYGLVNPIVLKTAVKKCCLRVGEGCLSVAHDHEGYVPRSARITVKAYDVLTGREEVLQQQGYMAVIFQHELDHLDGHLYYDHIDKSHPWQENPDWEKI